MLEQSRSLVLVILELGDELLHAVDPQQRKPPLDATDQRALLVIREIMPVLAVDDGHDVAERVFYVLPQVMTATCILMLVPVLHDIDKSVGNGIGLENKIDHSCRGGTVGHAGKPRAVALLDDCEAAGGLDGTHTEGAVAARA